MCLTRTQTWQRVQDVKLKGIMKSRVPLEPLWPSHVHIHLQAGNLHASYLLQLPSQTWLHYHPILASLDSRL